MEKQITELCYNFYSTNERGSDCEIATVGRDGVVEIIEHHARGEGDKWYYDIIKSDKTFERIFNPCRVSFK